jgi:hypothetical protein
VSDDDKPEKLLTPRPPKPTPQMPEPPKRPPMIMANPKGSIGFDRDPPNVVPVKPVDPVPPPPMLIGPPGNPKGNPMGRFPVRQELPVARVRPDPQRRKQILWSLLALVVAIVLAIVLLVAR